MKKTFQDIRILSLYKQHYFDHYNPDMDNQFSCLGYYDGISVTEIPAEDPEKNTADKPVYGSHLFEKKSQACLSRVWSGTVHRAYGLNGKYSKQNIGIFRCSTSEEHKNQTRLKWTEQNSPYFALALLQLKDRLKYAETEKEILLLSETPSDTTVPYIVLSVYHTYDNADLVVLIYSNSMIKTGKILDRLREFDNVCYLHSVPGISEAYLRACDKAGYILPEWKGINCFIKENIPHITLKIATSGKKATIKKLRKQFEILSENPGMSAKWYDEILFSFGAGHGNLIVDIKGTDMTSLLFMLVKDGLITHSNTLFGAEIYNIETTLYWKGKNISEIEDADITSEKVSTDNGTKPPEQKPSEPDPAEQESPADGPYFSALTKTYKEKMEEEWGEENEGLFSYYCALTQVCNTLAQYEGFSLSKDIFSLLYPSFRMFVEQLDNVSSIIKHSPSPDMVESFKDSICEFVNAVNSVVYHTVHTDQVFLMVPGYSGTTFSIPIKLCLIYSWSIRKVISILNDTDNKYACLLSPELETRPVTTLINTGLTTEDRLIRFLSSQRSLYMPRHFIILITHELAHYVGRDIRNRNLRLQCISKTLACLLAEGILPVHYCPSAGSQHSHNVYSKLYYMMQENIKKQIQEQCVRLIYDKVAQSPSERKEHATEMIPALREICYELLEERGIIHHIIFKYPENFNTAFSDSDLYDIMDPLYEFQNLMDRNRRILASSHFIIDSCIDELIQVFREVFSDVAALIILEYDMPTFSEVFNVSEGDKSTGKADVQQTVRKWIIQRVRLYKNKKSIKAAPSPAIIPPQSISNWPHTLRDELFSYSWVGKYLEEYAYTCADAVEEQTKKHTVETKAIQELYNIFSSSNASCNEIYDKMIHIISDYNSEVNEYYQKVKKKSE